MKYLLATVAVIVMAGCTGLLNQGPAIYDPSVPFRTVELDEDGDGLVDVAVYVDDAGGVIRDSQGRVLEVPNSREKVKQLDALDTNVGELLTMMGLFGVPFIGNIGQAIKNNKLSRRTAAIVGAVQNVREKAKTGDVSISDINSGLAEGIKTVAGTAELIAKIKADLKP